MRHPLLPSSKEQSESSQRQEKIIVRDVEIPAALHHFLGLYKWDTGEVALENTFLLSSYWGPRGYECSDSSNLENGKMSFIRKWAASVSFISVITMSVCDVVATSHVETTLSVVALKFFSILNATQLAQRASLACITT